MAHRVAARLGFWAPASISWWVAVSFMVGSALYILGTSASLWFSALLNEELAARIADWSYFVGATIFTAAVYLQILSTINADLHPIRARRTAGESFRWFAWQPKRPSFVEAFVLFVGSALFGVETFLALIGVSLGKDLSWLLSVPSLIGAVLFVAGKYMQVVQTCQGYLCFRPRGISWWSVAFQFLGCVGFVVGAAFSFGFVGLSTPTDPAIVKVAYLQGSVFFLIGSYLMFLKMFSK